MVFNGIEEVIFYRIASTYAVSYGAFGAPDLTDSIAITLSNTFRDKDAYSWKAHQLDVCEKALTDIGLSLPEAIVLSENLHYNVDPTGKNDDMLVLLAKGTADRYRAYLKYCHIDLQKEIEEKKASQESFLLSLGGSIPFSKPTKVWSFS